MTVTLETLRADYKAAEAAIAPHYIQIPVVFSGGSCGIIRAHKGLWTIAEIRLEEEVEQAGNILDVAEKHGIQAAMLYKLSDGNIDPRKAP